LDFGFDFYFFVRFHVITSQGAHEEVTIFNSGAWLR